MDRRSFLRGAAGVGSVALAGCSTRTEIVERVGSRVPSPSGCHSVLDASETASVNTPLGCGVHYPIVDNTDAGEVPAGSGAGPDGRLDASLELAVRDFRVLPW